MTRLIVIESCFGNTLIVAQAIAEGLTAASGSTADPESVTIVRAHAAPRDVPPEVRLLIVGAPTHNMSLPSSATRDQAADKGATSGESVGLREWLALVTPRPELRTVTFDTSVKSGFTFGSASKSAFKALRKRGFRACERGPSFYVADVVGPLADGEAMRAVEWGTELAGMPLGG